MQSKDIIVIVLGVVLSGILTTLFAFFDWSNIFRLNSPILIWLAILTLFLIILVSVWILYMRVRESEADLFKQATEQKRLGEKLKIYERLNKLELKIENLKNEKRK